MSREPPLIRILRAGGAGVPTGFDPSSGPLPDDALWVDACRPDEAEAEYLARATGLSVPTLAQLSEVESSSRLRASGEGLYLSLPIAFKSGHGTAATPVGVVLSARVLLTVRFEELMSFDLFVEQLGRGERRATGSVDVFVGLLEAVVDRLADVLEEVGADLDTMSERVFVHHGGRRPNRDKKIVNTQLRVTLRQVGRVRQLISKVRATLLGIGRAVPFVESECGSWLPDGARPHLATLKADVASLDEYEVHLSDKLQFLLDAALGFISIEQNDTFRVLTIVSVVGIPPTLISSMYGMNFKHMPELDWAWGYPYGLAVIALSALIPLAYFKHKGWF